MTLDTPIYLDYAERHDRRLSDVEDKMAELRRLLYGNTRQLGQYCAYIIIM